LRLHSKEIRATLKVKNPRDHPPELAYEDDVDFIFNATTEASSGGWSLGFFTFRVALISFECSLKISHKKGGAKPLALGGANKGRDVFL
jgi:hypothetical protein